MNHSLGQDTVVEVTGDEKPISWHVQQKINDREVSAYNVINRFNSATFLYLSQTKTWIYNVSCRGLFMFHELR
jgi:hypothetical protein